MGWFTLASLSYTYSTVWSRCVNYTYAMTSKILHRWTEVVSNRNVYSLYYCTTMHNGIPCNRTSTIPIGSCSRQNEERVSQNAILCLSLPHQRHQTPLISQNKSQHSPKRISQFMHLVCFRFQRLTRRPTELVLFLDSSSSL